jgi:eukaryotic-like serine/threonine-protein kinase
MRSDLRSIRKRAPDEGSGRFPKILFGNLNPVVRTGLLPTRYRGAQPIGKGGMGEIFRATDTTLGRAVAVKLLADRYAADSDVRGRFMREALAAARLSGDPHIVTIYDVGEHDERPYLVMEYLSGGSLEEQLRDGPVPLGRALRWLEQAAEALDHAHAEGVVHRDVKPANLLLDRHDDVQVGDFGIASATGLESLTMTGTVMGTAGYLSPEQAQGERATPASDRYGLAVLAFELLTGTRPYAGDSITAEASAHVAAPIPSASERNPQLPPEVDDVFRRGLAKDPRGRFPSCAEMVAALRQALDTAAGRTRPIAPVAAAPTRVAPMPARRAGRSVASFLPLLLAGLAAAVIGGVVLAAVLTRGDGSSAAERTVVHTVTAQGTTVRETVTQQASTQQATTAPSPPSAADGHTLNDQGYAKIQAGDFAGAVPLLQQAVQRLQGAGPGDPYEAYANYNLGYALYQLEQCGDAVPYLQRAQQLEPDRKEPGHFLKRAEKCAEHGD